MRASNLVGLFFFAFVAVLAGCMGGGLTGGAGADPDEALHGEPSAGPSDETPIAGDELVPEDITRETLDLMRVAIEMGLTAGKALVTEGINGELARSGLDYSYVGGESMVGIPEDALVECPYVLNAANDGTTSVSCRMLAEDARDSAYIHEADALSSVVLGPEFDADRELHEAWLRNGLASGIDGEYLMAVRRLRAARVCDQEPGPVESSREQGVAVGRRLFEEALEAQLAVTPITVCDIDGGIVNPALSNALGRVEGTFAATPLCPGYEPTSTDDRAEFVSAQNEYRAGLRTGVEEGAVIASEQLFRTWVCQTPVEAGGGGGGGGGGDPLVLDLDGDGVRQSGPAAGVNFELGPASMHRTGWVADPDDGFLAIDHDGDGRIGSGLELLGDMSWTPEGLSEQNGLLSLARYDRADLGGNGDGRIDADDAAFDALRVWRDRDLDGVTDPGELASLEDLGLESIGLDYVTGPSTLTATFERVDGSTGAALDLVFRYF